MVLEFVGFHKELNLQLKKLSPTTEEIVVECNDHNPVELIQALEATGESSLKSLSMCHVNITPINHVNNGGRRISFNQKRNMHSSMQYGQQVTIMDEYEIEKMKKEAEMYSTLFKPLSSLTSLSIMDGWGVMTEPVHYMHLLPQAMPLLETVEIGRNKESADDILVMTNESLSSLAKLNHLKSLHLLGFGGRAGNDMHLIKLDAGIDAIARKGQLEEFVFSASGVTFYGVIQLAKYCKNLKLMDVKCRFAAPGLFSLQNNIHHVKLGEHSRDKAEYLPRSDLRPLTIHLENIAYEESRYDPHWVNEAYPEETTSEEEGDGGD